jgi:accessory gene regulator B
MRQAAAVCVDLFIESQVIEDTKRDIYLYGLEILFSSGGTTIAALLLGHLFGMLTETLIFLLTFMPLRRCIGGYHASTPGKCFLLSLITVAVAVNAGRWFNPIAFIPIVMVSFILVLVFAPVIHPNHPHGLEKRSVLKTRARALGTAIVLAAFAMRGINPATALIIAVAFFSASVGLPLAILCNQSS